MLEPMLMGLLATVLFLLAPGDAVAQQADAVASLGTVTRRRRGRAPAPVPVDEPAGGLLPAPAVDPARSLLTTADRADLDLALRWSGVDRLALLGGRETTNVGRASPVDRWRLPSADAALHDPLWLPDRVGDVGHALSAELVAAEAAQVVPGWDALRALAGEELGLRPLDGCQLSRSRGLLHAVLSGPGLTRRQGDYLRGQLHGDLDRIAGDLLAQALAARCQVDLAFVGLSAADRLAVQRHLVTALGDEEEGDQEARASRALALATAWEHVDRRRLVAAGLAWSEAVRGATQALAALPPQAWPAGPLVVETHLGAVWIGSSGGDVLEGDPALILDPGGDDHWIVGPDRGLDQAHAVPSVRGVVDLGGADLYTGGAVALGGALLGLSAGVDRSGDDTWRTGPLSQGAAWFGVSTWHDGGGSDAWIGSAGVQGFAGYGLAVLRDAGEGDDLLRAGAWAQGCALSGGIGLLHDGGGDDRYVLGGALEDSDNRLPGHHNAYGQGFAIGQRPWLGGGLGWLQDDGGHDQYVGGLWVQGSSYWHALGVLLDREGNDLYSSDQYSQGSGIHLSAAGLFDLAGDDRYLTRNLGQGSGHDLAVSWLLDGGGDDVYTGQDTVQGAALTNAVSFFLDRSGQDLYVAASDKTRGFTNTARGYRAVAAFVDGGGDDRYLGGASGGSLAPEMPGSDHGVALDLVRDLALPEQAEPTPPTELGPLPSGAATARQLVLNNQRWLAPAANTAAAVDLLEQAGPAAVGWVLPLTSGELHLRSHTVGALIDRWVRGEDPVAQRAVAEQILVSVERWPAEPLDDSVRWHLRWLGELLSADPDLSDLAIAGADIGRLHPSWSVRTEAWQLAAAVAEAGALPRIMGLTWTEAAVPLLDQAAAPAERAAASRFLGRARAGDAARALAAILSTGSFQERAAAEDALVDLARGGHGTLVIRALDGLARGQDGPPRDAALRVAGASQLTAGLELLRMGLDSADAATRRAAALGLAAHGSVDARRLGARLGRTETDPRVLAALSGPEGRTGSGVVKPW